MFTTTYRLRINDINYGGHLGQAQLAMILHDARVRYLNDALGYQNEIDVDGAGLILTHESTDLLAEAFPNETLTIRILAKVTGAKLDMSYHIYVERRKVARSTAILAFFDYTRRKVIKPPPLFIEKIKRLEQSTPPTLTNA